MKHLKTTLLCTVAALCLAAVDANAQDNTGVTPHYLVYNTPYIEYLTGAQLAELNAYVDYEIREPCQKYRAPPNGFYRDGCDLKYIYPKPLEAMIDQAPMTERRTVLATYTVNFAFDSSTVQSSEEKVLEQVAREIVHYNPAEVAVSGYTDRAGTTQYNVALSQRRADTVSKLLNSRGVANRVINESAYGEGYSAVATNDGVPMYENRRVIIEFLK